MVSLVPHTLVHSCWAFSFPKQHPHPQILKITEDTQYLYLFCSQILIDQNRTKIHPHTKVIMSRGKLRYLFLTTLLRREAMVGTHGAREPLGRVWRWKWGSRMLEWLGAAIQTQESFLSPAYVLQRCSWLGRLHHGNSISNAKHISLEKSENWSLSVLEMLESEQLNPAFPKQLQLSVNCTWRSECCTL